MEILGEKSEICKFYHILVLVHILIGVIEDKPRTLKKRDFRQNEWGGGLKSQYLVMTPPPPFGGVEGVKKGPKQGFRQL